MNPTVQTGQDSQPQTGWPPGQASFAKPVCVSLVRLHHLVNGSHGILLQLGHQGTSCFLGRFPRPPRLRGTCGKHFRDADGGEPRRNGRFDSSHGARPESGLPPKACTPTRSVSPTAHEGAAAATLGDRIQLQYGNALQADKCIPSLCGTPTREQELLLRPADDPHLRLRQSPARNRAP